MTTLRRSSPSLDRLPSIKTLISESWGHFTKGWKDTFLLSRWLILPGALLLAVALLERFGQKDLGIFVPLIGVGAFALTAWVKIALIRRELGHASDMDSSPVAGGWKNVAAYIWTDIWHDIALIGTIVPFLLALIGLVVLVVGTQLPERAFGLLFAGSLLLAIPLIWMTVSLAFWPFILFDHSSSESAWERLRGLSRFPSLQRTVATFVSSYELVRGRWWRVFLRFLVPGFVFGVLFLASISLADSLIKVLAGPEKMQALFGKDSTVLDVNSGSLSGYGYFLQSLGLALFFPLFITWQATLYKMLKKES